MSQSALPRRVLGLCLAGLCLFGLAPAIHAQSTQTGMVTRIHVRATDGLIYFYADGVRSATPGCATQPYWIIANENSTAGKQQLAELLMAQAAGKPITVFGTGTCSRWPDGETVAEISVSD